jgi:hypothetical protein
MNGERGERGKTGDRGERGPQGDPGQGNQGNQGFRGGGGTAGPAGERGQRGQAGVDAVLIGRRALTIMVVALMLFVGGVGAVLSIVALRNNSAIERIEELRQQRVRDTAATAVAVCADNNRQDAILSALLRSTLAQRKREFSPPPTRTEQKLFKGSLKQLRPRDCFKLPAVKPYRAVPGPPVERE